MWLTRDERQVAGKAERLGVSDADEQRADQAGAFGDGDGGEIVERERRLVRERQAHHGHDGAQVFARGELGNHAAVLPCVRELGSDHGRENRGAIFDHRGRGFIARGFDAENSFDGTAKV